MNIPFGSFIQKGVEATGLSICGSESGLIEIISFMMNAIFNIIAIVWAVGIAYRIFFKQQQKSQSYSSATTKNIRADGSKIEDNNKQSIDNNESEDFFQRIKTNFMNNLISLIGLIFFVIIGVATKSPNCKM